MYSMWIALTNQLIAEKSVATISDQREYEVRQNNVEKHILEKIR